MFDKKLAAKVFLFPKLFVPTFFLFTGLAMPNSKCDILRIAEDYISKQRPLIETKELKPVISESEKAWQITYKLPLGTLGFVPVVTVDKSTCAVIQYEVQQ